MQQIAQLFHMFAVIAAVLVLLAAICIAFYLKWRSDGQERGF